MMTDALRLEGALIEAQAYSYALAQAAREASGDGHDPAQALAVCVILSRHLHKLVTEALGNGRSQGPPGPAGKE